VLTAAPQLIADRRKVADNVVSFPPLHFIICGFTPLNLRRSHQSRAPTALDLAPRLFDTKNMMTLLRRAEGSLPDGIGGLPAEGGGVSSEEADEQMLTLRARNTTYLVEWIPSNVRGSTCICDILPRGLKMSATLIGTTVAFGELFTRRWAVQQDVRCLQNRWH
jgi:tubulin beta